MLLTIESFVLLASTSAPSARAQMRIRRASAAAGMKLDDVDHKISYSAIGVSEQLCYCMHRHHVFLLSLAAFGTNITALLHHKRGANQSQFALQ